MKYVLKEALRAVTMSREHPSGKPGPGVITLLPAGALLTLRGQAEINAMVEVLYQGSPYAVFPQDLAVRASAVSAA